jgi:hypothetical protein
MRVNIVFGGRVLFLHLLLLKIEIFESEQEQKKTFSSTIHAHQIVTELCIALTLTFVDILFTFLYV